MNSTLWDRKITVNYTKIPNNLILSKLSHVAFRVFSTILMKPDGWKINMTHLCCTELNLSTKTRTKVQKELIEAGLLKINETINSITFHYSVHIKSTDNKDNDTNLPPAKCVKSTQCVESTQIIEKDVLSTQIIKKDVESTQCVKTTQNHEKDVLSTQKSQKGVESTHNSEKGVESTHCVESTPENVYKLHTNKTNKQDLLTNRHNTKKETNTLNKHTTKETSTKKETNNLNKKHNLTNRHNPGTELSFFESNVENVNSKKHLQTIIDSISDNSQRQLIQERIFNYCDKVNRDINFEPQDIKMFQMIYNEVFKSASELLTASTIKDQSIQDGNTPQTSTIGNTASQKLKNRDVTEIVQELQDFLDNNPEPPKQNPLKSDDYLIKTPENSSRLSKLLIEECNNRLIYTVAPTDRYTENYQKKLEEFKKDYSGTFSEFLALHKLSHIRIDLKLPPILVIHFFEYMAEISSKYRNLDYLKFKCREVTDTLRYLNWIA